MWDEFGSLHTLDVATTEHLQTRAFKHVQHEQRLHDRTHRLTSPSTVLEAGRRRSAEHNTVGRIPHLGRPGRFAAPSVAMAPRVTTDIAQGVTEMSAWSLTAMTRAAQRHK